jgi:hypothetical protein
MIGYALECYLCDSDATWIYEPAATPMQKVECKDCGTYRISEMLIDQLSREEHWPYIKLGLRAAVRWANENLMPVDIREAADIGRLIAVYDQRNA